MKTRAEKIKIIPADNMGAPETFMLVRGNRILSEHKTKPEAERALKIAASKVWQVYYDAKPDEILFEGGSRSAVLKYCREHDYEHWRKKGIIRIAQLIYEPENINTKDI